MEQERCARRALVTIAFSLVLIAALGVFAMYLGLARLNHPRLSEFPVQGIDVSHHQGEIDWARLAGPRVRFAYIKASEGATFRDPRFAANWRGAASAGVVPGAYHFFTLCRSGVEQAEHFIGVVSPMHGRMLPPAVDLEFGGNCRRRPAPEKLRAEVMAFGVMVEAVLGCAPVFYVTPEFHAAYVENHFDEPALWRRSIFRMPEGPGRDWLFWQFANRGRLGGIDGVVDLNVFHGDGTQFDELLCGRRDVAARRPARRGVADRRANAAGNVVALHALHSDLR